MLRPVWSPVGVRGLGDFRGMFRKLQDCRSKAQEKPGLV